MILTSFNCTLFEGSRLDGVTVDSLPPSIMEDKPYAVDEGYVSNCCRFIFFMMYMPPTGGGVHEVDLDFELEFRPFNGGGPRMIVFQTDHYGGLYGQGRTSIPKL